MNTESLQQLVHVHARQLIVELQLERACFEQSTYVGKCENPTNFQLAILVLMGGDMTERRDLSSRAKMLRDVAEHAAREKLTRALCQLGDDPAEFTFASAIAARGSHGVLRAEMWSPAREVVR